MKSHENFTTDWERKRRISLKKLGGQALSYATSILVSSTVTLAAF